MTVLQLEWNAKIVCLFGWLVVCLFVMKLLVLRCEKTKRSGDSFTIGMECQDWTGLRSDWKYRETSKCSNKDKVGVNKGKKMLK